MADASKRILEGNVALEVMRFGAPLVVAMVLQVTFNLVDAWIIGHLPEGEVGPALGALGICDQIAAMGSILSYGVSTATAARIAIAKGAGDHDTVASAAWQSLLIVLCVSVLFGLLGVLFGDAIMRDLVGAKGAVATVGSEYLRVILGGGFSIFFMLQLASIQRALGSVKVPAALLVLGNVLNVLLAVLLVFGPTAPAPFSAFGEVARALGIPKMGMVGAAWSSVITRSFVLAVNTVVVALRHKIVPPRGQRGPSREIRKILGIAWPASAQLVLRMGSILFTTSLVARAYTTNADQIASTAMGLVFRPDTMALFIAMGWGSAAQTFVGQNLGARQARRAVASGLWAVLFDAISNVALWALLARFGYEVLAAFDDDPAPLAIAMQYLRVVAPSYLGLGAAIVLANAIAGAGATRLGLAVDALVIVGVQVPISLLAVVVFGAPIDGLFGCVAASSVTAAVAFVAVYLRQRWMTVAEAAASDP